MAWGISTALFHRERKGEGQKLDVSLLQASLVLQNNNINAVAAHDGNRVEFANYLKDAFTQGASWEDVLARQSQSNPIGITAAYYGFFRTADQMLCLGAGGSVVQKRLLKVLGLSDPLLETEGYQPDDAQRHVSAQRTLVEQRLMQEKLEHWMPLLLAADVPASRVNLKAQLLDNEQVLANHYLSQMSHPVVGDITVVSPPVQFSKTSLEIRMPSPTLGQHSIEILEETGIPKDVIESLAQNGKIKNTE